MKRYIGIVLVVLVIFTSCNEKEEGIVYVRNYEFDEGYNENIGISIGSTESEIIDLYYDGNKEFGIIFEIWNDGELISSSMGLTEVEIDKTMQFGIIIEEHSLEEYKVHITDGGNDYSVSSLFTIKGPGKMLNGRSESVYIDTVSFDESEDILLWGYHVLDSEEEKPTDWSFKLRLKALN